MYCRCMANKEDNYICTTTYIQLLDLSSGMSHKILKLFSTEKNREFPTFTCIKSFNHWMASSTLQLLKPDSGKLLLTHFLFLPSTWNPQEILSTLLLKYIINLSTPPLLPLPCSSIRIISYLDYSNSVLTAHRSPILFARISLSSRMIFQNVTLIASLFGLKPSDDIEKNLKSFPWP